MSQVVKPTGELGGAGKPLDVLLLGTDTATRERVISTSLCLLCYMFSTLAAAMGVSIGVVKPWTPWMVALCTWPFTLWALWMVRTGRSQRFKDAALMLPQTMLALLTIAVAYVGVDANSRGLVLLFLPLVIVFGVYTHSSAQSILVGAGGVALLGVTVLVLSWVNPQEYPPDREIIRFELLFGCVLVLVYSSVLLVRWRNHLRKQRENLKSALQTVQHLAMHDVLTGLVNRRQMQDLLTEAAQAYRVMGETHCVALIDLDHFKRVNDTYGHQVGDEVLCGFARACEGLLGPRDVLARWGGEEFLLLVPKAQPQKVKAMLDVLQGQLRHQQVSATEQLLRVSFSAGVVECHHRETTDRLVHRADQALYAAKQAGRCRVLMGGE